MKKKKEILSKQKSNAIKRIVTRSKTWRAVAFKKMKLKWTFYQQSDMWRTKTFDIYDPCKRGTHVTLWRNGESIGFFAKLTTAKRVAQLISNG